MRVLITGATGFLGNNIVRALLKENYDVVILKRSFSRTERIEDILDYVTIYDIDLHNLSLSFNEDKPINAVIHTATNYGRENKNYTELLKSNLLFPLELLELAKKNNTQLFISIDTVLEKNTNLYALSKKQFTEWAGQTQTDSQTSFINIELQHMYGPGEDGSRIISHIINSCLQNEPTLALTEGQQQRDFIYIDDVVSAILKLLEHHVKTGFQPYSSYELGSGQAISLRYIAQKIHLLCKSKTVLNFGAVPYRSNELMFAQANIIKLKKLGWQPTTSLLDGLKQTIQAQKGVTIG